MSDAVRPQVLSDFTSNALTALGSYQASDFHRKHVDIVHHYTGYNSFKNIVSSKCIWLNETTFMNDVSESENFRLACVRNFERWVYGTDKQPHPRNRSRLWLIDDFALLSQPVFGKPAYLGSWSAESSLLSQWRAYCPRGGVSLGFRVPVLRDAARKQGLEAAWCDYNDFNATAWEGGREVESKMSTLWRDGLNNIFSLPIDFGAIDEDLRRPSLRESLAYYDKKSEVEQINGKAVARHKMRLLAEFSRGIAPVFKHSSFEEEGEFRIFATEPQHSDLHVRTTDRGLVRFLPLNLTRCWREALALVTLGPCDPQHEASLLNSTEMLLREAELAHVQVAASRIPLRLSS